MFKDQVMKYFGRNVIFTGKLQSGKGMMSSAFGAICITSFIYGVVRSFHLSGKVGANFGLALFYDYGACRGRTCTWTLCKDRA